MLVPEPARGAVGALVRYEDRRRPVFEPDGSGGFRQVGESTANALLFPPERWALVEWDDEAMLFLRPGAPGWIEDPYRLVQPEDLAGTLARAAADPAVRAAILAELDRKLETDPASRRARWLRDRLKEQAARDGLTLGAHLAHLADAEDRRWRLSQLKAAIARSASGDFQSHAAESATWERTELTDADS